jgi:hypothetical protein
LITRKVSGKRYQRKNTKKIIFENRKDLPNKKGGLIKSAGRYKPQILFSP